MPAPTPVDKHANTKAEITRWYGPNLTVADIDWSRASDPTRKYNCMGYAMRHAAGFLRWWQPPDVVDNVVRNPTHYWPNRTDRGEAIRLYVAAAATVGFTVCPTEEGAAWAEGAEKHRCRVPRVRRFGRRVPRRDVHDQLRQLVYVARALA